MAKNKADISVISKDVICNLLNSVCGNHTNFVSNERFYKATLINCRRWAKLYRGELSITIDELANLCAYLNIKFNADTFSRQLSIFDNGK